MSKTIKCNLPTSATSKSRVRYHELKNLLSWRQYDPGEDWAYKIGQDLLNYAAQEKSISFLGFYIWYGIPPNSYDRLRKKYKKLRTAHEMAKLMFADRRERLALERVHESRVAMFTLHKFHPLWKEVVQESVDLRKELAPKDTNDRPTELTVVMPDV